MCSSAYHSLGWRPLHTLFCPVIGLVFTRPTAQISAFSLPASPSKSYLTGPVFTLPTSPISAFSPTNSSLSTPSKQPIGRLQ